MIYAGLVIGHSLPLDRLEVIPLRSRNGFPFIKMDGKLVRVIQSTKGDRCQVVSTFFTVDAVIRDLDSLKFYDRISIDTRLGTNTVLMEHEIFSRRRIDELSGFGLFLDSKSIGLLLDYIARQENIAPTICQCKRVGWNFVDGNIRFLDYQGDSGLCYVGTMDIAPKGKSSHVTEKVDSLVKDSPGLMLALTASLSAALIGLLVQSGHNNVEPLLLHFFGQSSSGKTTALQLAASCWGNPAMGSGLLNSWHSTDNAILARANDNFGLALCFDESSIGERDFSNLIYCLSQGRDKDRLSKSCELQPQKRFATAIPSSGENSLIASCNKNVGIRARLLEFFNLPFTKSSSHSDEIKDYVSKHYGILGPAFARALSDDPVDGLWSKLTREKKGFESLLIEDPLPITERLCSKYALLTLTAGLANKRLGLHLDNDVLSELLIRHHHSYKADVDQGSRAYQAVLEWVVKNRSKLQQGNTGIVNLPVEGSIKGTTVSLLPSTYESIMKAAGFQDIKVISHVLREKDVLRPEKKMNGIQARVVINGVKTPCYRLNLPDLIRRVPSESPLNLHSPYNITTDDDEIDF